MPFHGAATVRPGTCKALGERGLHLHIICGVTLGFIMLLAMAGGRGGAGVGIVAVYSYGCFIPALSLWIKSKCKYCSVPFKMKL